MCSLPLAALVINVAKTGADYMNGQQAAKAQAQMINHGYDLQRAQTQRQYEQINQAAQDQSQQRFTEYLIEQGRLQAIGAESGLFGATQDRIEQEASNNADQDLATIEANRARQAEQAHSQGVANQMQAGVQLSGIKKPSALGAGLQIASAGMDYFKPPTK